MYEGWASLSESFPGFMDNSVGTIACSGTVITFAHVTVA